MFQSGLPGLLTRCGGCQVGLAQVDVSSEQSDQQYDGESSEQAQVLDEEEHHLGGGVLLGRHDAVHLRELKPAGDKG